MEPNETDLKKLHFYHKWGKTLNTVKLKFGIDCSKYELQNQHIIQMHMLNCSMSYHDSTSAPKREKHLSSGGMITRAI